jgi:hypothetical protein
MAQNAAVPRQSHFQEKGGYGQIKHQNNRKKSVAIHLYQYLHQWFVSFTNTGNGEKQL